MTRVSHNAQSMWFGFLKPITLHAQCELIMVSGHSPSSDHAKKLPKSSETLPPDTQPSLPIGVPASRAAVIFAVLAILLPWGSTALRVPPLCLGDMEMDRDPAQARKQGSRWIAMQV